MRFEHLDDLFEIAGGSFYRYIKGEGIKDLLHNIHCSNGLAWNEKEKKFYYIDSIKFDVKEFDYDPKSGNICKCTWIAIVFSAFKMLPLEKDYNEINLF